ncbi:MAG: YhbY family RNA-binding protein [Methanomethylovorans sp.]|jgi:RNA-binding protein|nr:YhbY family RNA-binding protein [Methanomethylovorans sp.]
MEKEKLYELKAKASQLKPIINVGKNGINESLIAEVKKQLKSNHIIKIKLLKSCREGQNTAQIAEELSAATNSQLIEIRGNTLVLYR